MVFQMLRGLSAVKALLIVCVGNILDLGGMCVCVFFFFTNQTRKSYGESQNVRHRKELSQEKRVLSKLLKDRKVCN